MSLPRVTEILENLNVNNLTALLGEVQANPTTNTVLERLKAIATLQGAGNTSLASILSALTVPETPTFQNAAIITGNGLEFEVGYYNNLTVEITGTSTSRTIRFYAKSESGALVPLTGFKAGDLTFTPALSTTGTSEVWQFSITGYVSIIMDLNAVDGGNVTIKGRATV